MEKGVPIRSISRSIAVLQCINCRGSLSLTEIARLVMLPYPTVFRIIQTLMHEGLVTCEQGRKQYRATCMVESLAAGYREDGSVVDAAQPHMIELTRHVGWPVTLSSAVGTSIIIRACTHNMSALTLSQYYRGDIFPLLECAPGHVHLAYSDEATRDCLLQGLEKKHGSSVALELFRRGQLTRRILDDGYAAVDRTQHTKDPGKTSSISVPLQMGAGRLAHLTVNFFASAMPLKGAVQRYLPDLRATADTIVAGTWMQPVAPQRRLGDAADKAAKPRAPRPAGLAANASAVAAFAPAFVPA